MNRLYTDKKSNISIYFLKECFATHGIPERLDSDSGPNMSLESLKILERHKDFNTTLLALVTHKIMV